MSVDNPNLQFEILQRRKAVCERYLRGESQWTIARAFEVSQPTIAGDLKAIRAEWMAASVAAFDERKAQELAKVDELERVYWQAWAKSQMPKKVKGRKKNENGIETTLREERRDGDPRFLDGILRCIEKRCAIVGIIKPGATNINIGNDAAFQFNLNQLNDERLAQLSGILAGVFEGHAARTVGAIEAANGNGAVPP
jgi:hypothetical protein